MSGVCTRPGCGGKIVDGYCDTCGKAATVSVTTAKPAPPVQRATPQTATVGSASSRGSISTRTGSGSSRRSSRGTRVGSDRLLGAGFVSLPELPSQDPLLLIISDPVVPERKRFCSNCDAKLTREKGFCPNCGSEYSFIPTLEAGEVLENQFEIKGPIAFGGLGWIYLGWDKVLSRWTVLKGLLNSKDPVAAAAALAERQFLAAVKHPKIVNIYNFITRGTEGFIVMEFVGGKTIKSIRQERGPLPPAEAIAYIHGILPAFAYLHRQGYVYCDFKPDNFMLEGDDVKLIDLGGVRKIDDLQGDIYGTKGYTAPEAAEDPSISSDLYTVARTLAVLMFDFPFQTTYRASIPPATEQPLLAEFDSLRRWLIKATATDPDHRFQAAEEMADQLLGVLRDVASKSGTVKHVESKYFYSEMLKAAEAAENPAKYELPSLKLDPSDPATPLLIGLVGLGDEIILENLKGLNRKFGGSLELQFFKVQVHLNAGRSSDATLLLKEIEKSSPDDWRLSWFRGVIALREGRSKDAGQHFDLVMNDLPGEVAPRLARAVALEISEETVGAAKLYQEVSLVEPSFVSAFFGLARCQARQGDKGLAVATLSRIPSTSSLFGLAKMKSAQLLTDTKSALPSTKDLALASETLQTIPIEGYEMNHLSATLLLAAIASLKGTNQPDPSVQILGQPFTEQSMRMAAEKQLRKTAKYATSEEEKFQLIHQANSVRPWTLF